MNLFPPPLGLDRHQRRDRLCAQLTRAASPLFLCLCGRRRSPARAWICITPALSSQIPCCIILRSCYAIIRYEGIVRNRLWQLEPIGEDLIDALVSFCPQDIFTIAPHNSADVSFPIRRCSPVLRRSRIRPVQMKRDGKIPDATVPRISHPVAASTAMPHTAENRRRANLPAASAASPQTAAKQAENSGNAEAKKEHPLQTPSSPSQRDGPRPTRTGNVTICTCPLHKLPPAAGTVPRTSPGIRAPAKRSLQTTSPTRARRARARSLREREGKF